MHLENLKKHLKKYQYGLDYLFNEHNKEDYISNNAFKNVRKLLNELRSNLSHKEINRIREKLNKKENEQEDSLTNKEKKESENIVKHFKNLKNILKNYKNINMA